MPNLLNVNSYHYRRGGSDVVYFEHAALMASAGWNNACFSMHHPKNEASPWERYFIDELEFGQTYSAMDKIKMASKVIYSFEAQRKLSDLLKVFKADVAHLHCIYHHQSPSILYTLRDHGIPAVMTAHDLKIACPAYKMLNHTGICERCKDGSVLNVIKYKCIRDSTAASVIVAAESALHRSLKTYQRLLTKVVAPSQFYLTKLTEWGIPSEKIAYIPNYVNANLFTPRFAAGDYFLYFGRLAPEKGVGTLIKAAHAAKAPLKIAGTGPMEQELKSLASTLGSDAEFVGFKSGADLHELIQGARAVVLPSEWYENAPMSVLESFALGKPVIGADIGGIPEMITPGETGWTFDSAHVAQLTSTLESVMRTSGQAITAMGRAARSSVERHFTLERYQADMLELYARLDFAN
jgi:glycosyltransferase involved in cell wall biosynthesis